MKGRPANVLIADSEPIVRFGVTEYLRRRTDLRICGEADTAPAARTLCERHSPSVLILDPGLSGGEGFSLIKEAPRWSPHIRVIAFTGLEDASSMIRAFRAGAVGYVTRQEPLPELGTAIDAALAGKEYMAPRVQHIFYAQMRTGHIELASNPAVALSARERQIFELVGQGLGKREISAELNLSPKTVDTHQQRIKDKLGIASCAELRKHAASHFRGSHNHQPIVA